MERNKKVSIMLYSISDAHNDKNELSRIIFMMGAPNTINRGTLVALQMHSTKRSSGDKCQKRWRHKCFII